MTLLTLNPSSLMIGAGNPLNLTAALVSLGSNTGVTFVNSGRELLVVSLGSTATTLTSDIGLTIQGQTVPGVSSGALAANDITVMPPYPLQFNRTDGSGLIQVDFSSSVNVSVALLHVPGVS